MKGKIGSGNLYTTDDVTLRPATVQDIDLVQDMIRVIWGDTFQGILPQKDQAQVLRFSYSRESLMKSVRENVFLLSEVRGAAAGFVDMGMLGDVLYLHRLYVMPQYQRRGLGRRMLENAISKNESLSCSLVVATVETENLKARAFYRKMGFAEEDITTLILGDVEIPAIYIVLKLR